MDIESFRLLCLSLPQVTEDMPYDDTVVAFRLKTKIFACFSIDRPEWVVLKCDAGKAIELRELYPEVEGAYHCNKKYWNQIRLNGNVGRDLIAQWVVDAWNEVDKKLPKRDRLPFVESI